MQIREQRLKVRDIAEEYFNDDANGVVGYKGNLDIRPKYQREFVYKDKQRNEVINTVLKGYPLSIMYWVDRGENYTDENDEDAPRYEVLDGQQRTISLCEYVNNGFSMKYGDGEKYFKNLPQDVKNRILDYELIVYVCTGTESEKLDWFKTINIAGEKLTQQELRNAVYAGPWVSSAKTYFSKNGCAAYGIGSNYMSGEPIRQDYLNTALTWIANRDKTTIDDYMAQHQHDSSAQKLWMYYRSVIEWVQETFPVKRREMKGLPWGLYYNKHGKRKDLVPDKLEEQIKELFKDDDVKKKKGIYEYVLTGNESALNIREFSESEKSAAYERQDHKCAICDKEIEYANAHADHIKPWSKGGKTEPDNLQILCRDCNLKKGAQE